MKIIVLVAVMFLSCYGQLLPKEERGGMDSSKWAKLMAEVEEIRKLRLEEYKVSYKERFNREVPDWEQAGISTIRSALKSAFLTDVPYLTKEEEEIIKNESEKIKSEYKKRFGESISDFELSTTRVCFRIGGAVGAGDLPHILVSRTATGTLAKYVSFENEEESFEIQLSIGEWLDFIRALYKNKVDKWETHYTTEYLSLDGIVWSLQIFSLDNGYFSSGGSNAYPLNWDIFIKIMDDMEAKIKRYEIRWHNLWNPVFPPFSDF